MLQPSAAPGFLSRERTTVAAIRHEDEGTHADFEDFEEEGREDRPVAAAPAEPVPR